MKTSEEGSAGSTSSVWPRRIDSLETGRAEGERMTKVRAAEEKKRKGVARGMRYLEPRNALNEARLERRELGLQLFLLLLKADLQTSGVLRVGHIVRACSNGGKRENDKGEERECQGFHNTRGSAPRSDSPARDDRERAHPIGRQFDRGRPLTQARFLPFSAGERTEREKKPRALRSEGGGGRRTKRG